mgnify:CR=1 FL=1
MNLAERAKSVCETVHTSLGNFVHRAAGFVKKHKRPIGGCALALAAAIAFITVFTVIRNNTGNDPVDGPVSVDASQYAPETTSAPTAAATKEPEPTVPPDYTPAPLHLYYGCEDYKVIDIQTRLMELNYMDYDEPTDYYGTMTTSAVMLFQRRNGLDVTGQLYQSDYDLLMSDGAKQYMASIGDKGTDITEMQKRLYELDYIDTVTGTFGDVTEEAVKRFQEKNRLTVDGKVGPATKEALYSEDAVPNSLYIGSEGEEVQLYQDRLYLLGYLTTKPDGKYGSDTVTAVKRFQERNGLVVDGYLGPSTKRLLTSNEAKGNKIESTMSGSDVKNIQNRLYELNYLRSSAVTGYFGAVTEAAVRLFQKNNKLTVDGKVGMETMNKLFSSSAKRSSYPVTSGSGSGGSSGGSGGSGYATGTVEAFISIARSKLGCPYVRGAKGPNAFDCSGFVFWCLNKAGVSQGYMTSYMWRTTTRYQRINSIGSIKRGDVIVFKMGATSGHVAIALGGGMMIDASSRNGKVVIRSYQSAYWYGTFYCAYRIFGG